MQAMIAHVVPVVRLRRATTWWSYKVPPRSRISPGSLVVIPLRNRSVPGIVWAVDTNPDAEATDSIERVLVHDPLIKLPTRNYLEWLAENTCSSLSTVSYLQLPALLRSWPYRKPTLEALAAWRNLEKPASQQLFLLPAERGDVVEALRASQPRLTSWFDAPTETEELVRWLACSSGEMHTVVGRERGVFTNFANLTSCIVQDPEDISYYHQQTPYLSIVEAAEQLATHWNAALTYRSALPAPIQKSLWPGGEHGAAPLLAKNLQIAEIRQKEIINDEVVTAIQAALVKGEQVLILYNARDRLYKSNENPLPLLIPGIETLRTKLALRLGGSQLPDGVHMGTRAIFKQRYQRVGLCVCLSIDPVLYQQNFADELHGWADLYKLLSYSCRTLVQTSSASHPALLALRERRLTEYLQERIHERENLQLPPFATTVACSIGTNQIEEAAVQVLADLLRQLSDRHWRVSAPLQRNRRGTSVWTISLHAPPQSRLPQALHKKIAALPRPWKIERNPWYAL